MHKTVVPILAFALILTISSTFCTYLPSSRLVPTLPSGRLDATMVALQNLAAAQSTSPTQSTGVLATASISGKLSYPGHSLPAMHVVAYNLKNSAFYTATVHLSGIYQIDHLPAGGYHVVAYASTKSGASALAGGYSQAVVCGLSDSCTDHSLVLIRVVDGAKITGIDPDDFNAPASTFPQDPVH